MTFDNEVLQWKRRCFQLQEEVNLYKDNWEKALIEIRNLTWKQKEQRKATLKEVLKKIEFHENNDDVSFRNYVYLKDWLKKEVQKDAKK